MVNRVNGVCPFIEGRECSLEAGEIPLEVCRLCLDTWKAQNETIMVKRSHPPTERESVTPLKQKEGFQVEGGRRMEPSTVLSAIDALDRRYMEDRVERGEYLRKRKELTDHLQQEKQIG